MILTSISSYLDPDPLLLATRRGYEGDIENPRFHALNQAIVHLVRAGTSKIKIASQRNYIGQIEDHPLVSFLPLDLTKPDSLETVVSHIDYTMQYGEDEEPKEVRSISLSLFFECRIKVAFLAS